MQDFYLSKSEMKKCVKISLNSSKCPGPAVAHWAQLGARFVAPRHCSCPTMGSKVLLKSQSNILLSGINFLNFLCLPMLYFVNQQIGLEIIDNHSDSQIVQYHNFQNKHLVKLQRNKSLNATSKIDLRSRLHCAGPAISISTSWSPL